MSHGVVMNVVRATVEIILIPDDVIPEAMLPHPSSCSSRLAVERPEEAKLDALDYAGDVGRLRVDNCMKVVRENNPTIQVKWNSRPRPLHRRLE